MQRTHLRVLLLFYAPLLCLQARLIARQRRLEDEQRRLDSFRASYVTHVNALQEEIEKLKEQNLKAEREAARHRGQQENMVAAWSAQHHQVIGARLKSAAWASWRKQFNEEQSLKRLSVKTAHPHYKKRILLQVLSSWRSIARAAKRASDEKYWRNEVQQTTTNLINDYEKNLTELRHQLAQAEDVIRYHHEDQSMMEGQRKSTTAVEHSKDAQSAVSLARTDVRVLSRLFVVWVCVGLLCRETQASVHSWSMRSQPRGAQRVYHTVSRTGTRRSISCVCACCCSCSFVFLLFLFVLLPSAEVAEANIRSHFSASSVGQGAFMNAAAAAIARETGSAPPVATGAGGGGGGGSLPPATNPSAFPASSTSSSLSAPPVAMSSAAAMAGPSAPLPSSFVGSGASAGLSSSVPRGGMQQQQPQQQPQSQQQPSQVRMSGPISASVGRAPGYQIPYPAHSHAPPQTIARSGTSHPHPHQHPLPHSHPIPQTRSAIHTGPQPRQAVPRPYGAK